MNSILIEQALSLHRSGQLAEAEALYRQAVATDPQSALARQLLGVARAQGGRAEDGLADLDAALALSPQDADIHLNRATVLVMLKRFEPALAAFDSALAIRPDWPQALNSRGSLLQEMKRPAAALDSYERALALMPGFTAAINNRGSALMDLMRPAEALAAFEQALALKPEDPVVLTNRGNALQKLGRYPEALAAYDRALALSPDYAKALANRGGVLQHLKRHAAALADFDRALALEPSQPQAFAGAAMAGLSLCDWPRASRIGETIAERALAGDVPPWTLLGYSSDEQFQLAVARHAIAARFPESLPPLATAPYRHHRIRLGYISSDFCDHPVAHQIVQVIETHDRAHFEVIGFSTGRNDNSAVRKRLAAAFEKFHDLQGESPVAIAQMIRDLDVDVLIDLNGHTEGDHFDVLARRPAPVQATWLGYAGSSGAPFLDYCIADAVVAPDASAFSEKLLQLPHCFFPTDASRTIAPPPRRAEAGLPPDGFVFCSFNQNWKFTAPVFAVWMQLLQRVEGSVLWLKQPAEAADNLRAAARAHGVDPARLVFASHADAPDHLARHALADLFLDTLPYNAHATACDALWAGLPVLTCAGTAFAGRVAASMLTALGLPELIAQTLEEYEARALELARNPARLKALRERLTAARTSAPLFDTPRFTRNLETALIALAQPTDAATLTAQGLQALDSGDNDTALTLLDRAIAADPGLAAAHQGRGRVLAMGKDNERALQSFERALALDPGLPDGFDGLALTALHLCDWQRTEKIAPELERRIAAGQEISPWTVLGYSGDAALQLRAARRDIAQRVPPFAPLWRGERYRHDRIRLAYISADLRQHVVGGQIAELIERHDRSRFQVIGIATTPDDGSALRARLTKAFDAFYDVSGRNVLEIAQGIRALEVDVLVDLNGHTQGENFGVLAQRPAPVQLGWLGYAGTTGTDFQQLLVDAVVAPDDTEFSEKLVRLPHSFFTGDTSRPIGTPPSRAQEGLPETGFVFCSFNNNWKITAPVFASWMRLLQVVPGSVLWLRQSGGGADANLVRAAQKHGIARERLVFAARAEIGVHLARHALADLFLDTLPYNAHATCWDALYAGLPVLTCKGNAFAGRVAASMLTALDMPELITNTPDAYEARALELAHDPAQLQALRAKLAANRATAPLFDTARFARDFEAAISALL